MTYFYIYLLIDPRDNIPFYVGKGRHIPGRTARWRNHLQEARKWDESCKWGNVQKLQKIKSIFESGQEPTCKIVYKTEKEEDAFSEERNTIKRFGRLVEGGILTNLTIGGEGLEGHKLWKQERREVHRKKMLGENNPMYGRQHSEETKQQISETRSQRLESGEIIPTKHTAAHRDKMRQHNSGGEATAKPIYQISKTGKVVRKWKSTREAGMELNLKSWRNISFLANKKLPQTAYGYYWRWADDPDIKDGTLVGIDSINNQRSRTKAIVQKTPNGEFVKQWISMKAISQHYNVAPSIITRAVKEHREFRGSVWEYL